MKVRWEDGFQIRVGVWDGGVTVSANREGLLSLSRICADLAQERPGSHIHLDENNSLEEGSAELIVEKVE